MKPLLLSLAIGLMVSGFARADWPFGDTGYECKYSKCEICGKQLAEVVEVPKYQMGYDNMPIGGYRPRPTCSSTDTPKDLSYSKSLRVCETCQVRFGVSLQAFMNEAYEKWYHSTYWSDVSIERKANDDLAREKEKESKRRKIEELKKTLEELEQ